MSNYLSVGKVKIRWGMLDSKKGTRNFRRTEIGIIPVNG